MTGRAAPRTTPSRPPGLGDSSFTYTPPAYSRTNGYDMPMASKYLPAWRRVLRECRYPEDVVVIDFETYFDSAYTLKKLSTIEYIMDKRYEETGVSVLRVDGETNFPDYLNDTVWHDGEAGVKKSLGMLQAQYGQNLEGCTVVAQNSMFDMSVLAYRHGIHPPYMIDTAGLSRHWDARNSHKLKDLTKRHGLPDKGDTMKFTSWTNKLRYLPPTGRNKTTQIPEERPRMTAAERQSLGDYALNDVWREWELFTIMLPLMSTPATELRVMQHTLDLYLRPTLTIDHERAEDLKSRMRALMDEQITATGCELKELTGTNSFDDLMGAALSEAGDTIAAYTKPAKNTKGWVLGIAKDDYDRELLLTHKSERVRTLLNGRIAAKSWPTHIGRIESFQAQCRAAGGRLPIPLKYHGAHTARWSGDEGLNPQNLGSRGHELVSEIRTLIVARDGYTLAIVDYAQIEARGVAWIAGQDDLLRDFEDLDANPGATEDVYTKFASKVLERPCDKSDKWARNAIGKIGVLGCGYGMGADKAEVMAAGEITNDQAVKIVKQYRKDNKEIVKFWSTVERAFKYTLRYKKAVELPRGLRLHSRPDCDVVITLPNGRELKYVQARITKSYRFNSRTPTEQLELYDPGRKRWNPAWGGVLTENIVQAISRDVLVEGLLRIEAAGYRVPLHVHDEYVCMVVEDTSEHDLEAIVKLMAVSPTWAPNWPINAEGQLSKHYKKI